MAQEKDISIILKLRDEASKQLEAFSGVMGGSFKQAQTASLAFAGGLAAVGVAAAGVATKSILDFSNVGDAVEKMAKRTGLSTEAISALRVAADMGGTSIEAVEGAIKKMNISMVKGDQDSSKLEANFAKLGLSLSKNFFSLSPEAKFNELARTIGSISDPTEKSQAAMLAFGKSGADLIPLFEDGKFSMESWKSEAQRLGVSFDQLSADKAAQLNDSLGEMHASFSGLSLQIGSSLAPLLIPLLKQVTDLIAAFSKWFQEIGGVEGAIRSIKQWIEDHKVLTGLLAGAIVGALVPAFIGLASTILFTVIPAVVAMAISLAPFIIGGAIIGGIVAGILWVIQHWELVKTKAVEIFSAVATFFKAHWGLILSIFTGGLSIVAQYIVDHWTEIKTVTLAVWNNIKEFFVGLWDGIKATFKSAIDWLMGIIQPFLDAVNKVISGAQTVGSVIGKGAGAIGGAISSGASAVVGGVKKIFGINDAVISPNGNIVTTHPDDWLIATKTPQTLGQGKGGNGGIIVNVTGNSFYGGDASLADMVGDAIYSKLAMQLRI